MVQFKTEDKINLRAATATLIRDERQSKQRRWRQSISVMRAELTQAKAPSESIQLEVKNMHHNNLWIMQCGVISSSDIASPRS